MGMAEFVQNHWTFTKKKSIIYMLHKVYARTKKTAPEETPR